jgi:alpha-mannosidase
MPSYARYTTRQLRETLEFIAAGVYMTAGKLAINAWWSPEPLPFLERMGGEPLDLVVGDKWGDLFDCAWFHFTGRVPDTAAGKHVVLLLDVSGEMCVFDAAGHPQQGLTTTASGYDFSLGKPGKRVLDIAPKATGGETVDVWADAGCNDLFGNLQGNGTVAMAEIAICNDNTRALYYDFEVLLDLLGALPEDSPQYQRTLVALNDVAHLWMGAAARYAGSPEETAQQARAILAPLLKKRNGDTYLQITASGHAHMDLGWLWPIRETIRKGARTFSTALRLLDRYPDYIFGASQPQYFLWMKLHYPDLYARIKAKVAEGRIEPQGAMWVEADTNTTGGEALVRQLLQGKRFFREEFGIDLTYLWLPDVFGYNGALPQILRLAGVDYFSTQKLSWSLINAFPHQSFHWQGIDGSCVLTHMLPEETYNSPASPRSIRMIEQNYRDTGVSSHAMMIYGIGDGGGGPGEEHLERMDRIRDLAGLSPVKQAWVSDFFEEWKTEADRFATWTGELYLERHEGTLTTEARNKWYNRKMELGLRELEWSAALAARIADAEYPAEALTTLWRETLLYQFHDILPGSSIKRVYDESLERYNVMLAETQSLTIQATEALAARISTGDTTAPVLIWNSLPWLREAWVADAEGRWLHAEVPPMGYMVIDAGAALTPEAETLKAEDRLLENTLARVTFGADGTLTSFMDKQTGREVIVEGRKGNQLLVYADPGDAWDFPMDYAEQIPQPLALVSQTPRVEGPRAIMTQVYRVGHSELTQEVVLTAGSCRLDFISHLRWREAGTMLRTQFPVAIHADAAMYEIQFGSLLRSTHRNTTWDLARDEAVGHKWVDVSESDYGVALLNDSKYGHKIKTLEPGGMSVLDLNLLRSTPYPGPRLVADETVLPGQPHHAYTDQADHRFTYALYPHTGNHIAGGVIQEGYALNVPLRTLALDRASTGDLPLRHSFLELSASNIVIEAVKQAEDSEALIVRLYESANRRSEVTLRVGFPVNAIEVVNLMEENPESLEVRHNLVTLIFRPFEIKTLKIS